MAFFGHMSRNEKCNITKDIIQGKTNGKRKKGRQRLSYMDNISHGLDLHRMQLSTLLTIDKRGGKSAGGRHEQPTPIRTTLVTGDR